MLDPDAGYAIDRLTGYENRYFQFKLVLGLSTEVKIKMIYNMGLFSIKDLGSPDLSAIIIRVKRATLSGRFYKVNKGFPCVYNSTTAIAPYNGNKISAKDINNGVWMCLAYVIIWR